jgi:biopolymer transport protein ExbD
MAEIQSAGPGRNGKGQRAKKLSTRIDLTPMVDLGFLLIAFFMVTTTLAKPRSMEINMPFKPAAPDNPTEVPESTALTILPGKGHQLFYYEGFEGKEPGSMKIASFSGIHSIRSVISEKKARINKLKASGDIKPEFQLTVLIKPDTSSTYGDLVALLDEMGINDVQTYAIVDISASEQQKMQVAGVK